MCSQVGALEVAAAGEEASADITVSVKGALFRAILSLSAAYPDAAGAAPELFLTPSSISAGAAHPLAFGFRFRICGLQDTKNVKRNLDWWPLPFDSDQVIWDIHQNFIVQYGNPIFDGR